MKNILPRVAVFIAAYLLGRVLIEARWIGDGFDWGWVFGATTAAICVAQKAGDGDSE